MGIKVSGSRMPTGRAEDMGVQTQHRFGWEWKKTPNDAVLPIQKPTEKNNHILCVFQQSNFMCACEPFSHHLKESAMNLFHFSEARLWSKEGVFIMYCVHASF